MTIKVTSLHLYPVKSLAGISVDRIEMDSFGPKYDRRWLVVDGEGRFLTQRQHPLMAKVKVRLTEKSLILIQGKDSVEIPFDQKGGLIEGSVWSHVGPMIDCGKEASRFLSYALSTESRLMRMPDEHKRVSNGQTQRPISFVDSRQLLVVSTESLDWLNSQLISRGEAAMPMDRFRANIVLTGGEGRFYEDKWAEVKLGTAHLEREKMCGRCVVITTDQENGQRMSPAPLAILAKEHPAEGGKGAAFGTYFNSVDGKGVISIGDEIA